LLLNFINYKNKYFLINFYVAIINTYSYVVYILLYYIMVSVNNNRLIYYIDMGGTLIYSIVILFFLYIVKFYNMHFAKIIIKNESNSRCIQYQNCSVHALERSRI